MPTRSNKTLQKNYVINFVSKDKDMRLGQV